MDTKHSPGRIAHNVVMGCGDSDDFDFLSSSNQRLWEDAVTAAVVSIATGGGWSLSPVRGRESTAVYLTRQGGVALCIEHYGDKAALAELQALMAAIAKATTGATNG